MVYPALDNLLDDNNDIPQVDTKKDVGTNYRITEVCKIRDFFEAEIKARESTCGKYSKIITGTFIVELLINVLTGVLAGLPLIRGIEINSVAMSASACVFIAVQLFIKGLLGLAFRKCKKHEAAAMLARSKLDSVGLKISRVLNDGFVSDEEFRDVLSELTKFHRMIEKIKTGTIHTSNPHVDETELKLAETRALLERQSKTSRDVEVSVDPNMAKMMDAFKAAFRDAQIGTPKHTFVPTAPPV